MNSVSPQEHKGHPPCSINRLTMDPTRISLSIFGPAPGRKRYSRCGCLCFPRRQKHARSTFTVLHCAFTLINTHTHHLSFRQPNIHKTTRQSHALFLSLPKSSLLPRTLPNFHPPTMERMQCVFNMNMDPIETHEDYPKYARSTTKPVVRARHIIDRGVISRQPCSTCVELGQDCYRLESTFSKCAYCTSKDRKRELCHLPGQEASSSPERRKRRKM